MTTAATVTTTGLVLDGLVLDVPGLTDVLRLDLALPAGQSLAVTGPSGTGKTTLLAALAGLAPNAGGIATWNGTTITTHDDVHRRRVGYVPQGYGLISTLTAVENVAVPLLASRSRGTAWSAARDMLERVGLTEQADHLTDQLSGGQQQRVAVARALAARPELILADEPTSELDAASRRSTLDLILRSTREFGATIVIATHDPEVAAACDRQVSLDRRPRHARRGRHRTRGPAESAPPA